MTYYEEMPDGRTVHVPRMEDGDRRFGWEGLAILFALMVAAAGMIVAGIRAHRDRALETHPSPSATVAAATTEEPRFAPDPTPAQERFYDRVFDELMRYVSAGELAEAGQLVAAHNEAGSRGCRWTATGVVYRTDDIGATMEAQRAVAGWVDEWAGLATKIGVRTAETTPEIGHAWVDGKVRHVTYPRKAVVGLAILCEVTR